MDDNEVMSYGDLKSREHIEIEIEISPTVYILSTQKGKTGRGLRSEHAKGGVNSLGVSLRVM